MFSRMFQCARAPQPRVAVARKRFVDDGIPPPLARSGPGFPVVGAACCEQCPKATSLTCLLSMAGRRKDPHRADNSERGAKLKLPTVDAAVLFARAGIGIAAREIPRSGLGRSLHAGERATEGNRAPEPPVALLT